MRTSATRHVAAATAVAAAAVHLALLGEYLEEAPYVGVLFVIGSAALVYAAVGVWRRDDPLAWAVGAAVSAGMIVGFVLSRTVGLPGFHEADWDVAGIVSMGVEAGYLAAAWAKRPRLLVP